jgi:hypothetical protein
MIRTCKLIKHFFSAVLFFSVHVLIINQVVIYWQNNQQKKKPNKIIVILVDDAGYVDFGFMGSELETPHIDNLAKAVLCLQMPYVSATVCAPSRAGL